MVSADSAAIDFVLPVCVSVAKEFGGVRILAVVALDEVCIFCCVEEVEFLCCYRIRNVSVVRDARSLIATTFLCSDDDDTVRAAATVDGSSGSVLEDGERLNIVRVDHRERVRKTFHALVVHSETVDDDERVIRCVERRAATDADCCASARGTRTCRDANTGNLTLNHVLCVSDETVVLLVRLESSDRTCEVVLLRYTVTDDNDFVEESCVFLENDDERGLCLDGHSLITY